MRRRLVHRFMRHRHIHLFKRHIHGSFFKILIVLLEQKFTLMLKKLLAANFEFCQKYLYDF